MRTHPPNNLSFDYLSIQPVTIQSLHLFTTVNERVM